MTLFDKFAESRTQFSAWRKESGKLAGFRLWHVEFAGFILEAWNDGDGNMILFQVFEHGRGFKAFTQDSNFIGQYKLEL